MSGIRFQYLAASLATRVASDAAKSLILSALTAMACVAAEPRVLVDGYKLELVAREPDIVTPISMAFDGKGRLLVIESHTHQRPLDYLGPEGDRVRMLADSDGDGKLDRWSTFAEGFQQAMNLCVRPDGGVYLVTRRDVRLLRDTHDDGLSDKDDMLLRLETEDEYPHNALSGVAFVPAGNAGDDCLYLGLGENHGLVYKLIDGDGKTIEDHGGAGMVFRCRPDGGALERFATGFWNPFSLCMGGNSLFCVDNDPDASPPCRLIEVLPAGDYGHRYEYSRAGTHPLQAWDGELPGTLPMICGTGEAPTAVVAHRDRLWVTSWGEHRIERYDLSLETVGHYAAQRTVVVQGDADFRPTGMAVAADGSLYFADWVDRSYPVHGKGRIWRLQLPAKANEQTEQDAPAAAPREDVDVDRAVSSAFGVLSALFQPRPPLVYQSAIFDHARMRDGRLMQAEGEATGRLFQLQALRWQRLSSAEPVLREALADADPDVRLYAVRWIADERITALRDEVARLLDGEMPSERYFLAVLAAIDWLDGDAKMRDSGISDELLLRELQNAERSPELHALALRLISPDHKWLTVERLRAYSQSEHSSLRLEAVRTLAQQNNPERFKLLAEVAGDESREAVVRAEAVAGLAAAVDAHGELLARLAGGNEPTIAGEAGRVLRLSRKRTSGREEVPDPGDLDEWTKLLAHGGDAESGRRLFFTSAGPRCAACHQHRGRGGRVGPDLTHIGRQQSRERIVASILQPSREVAPAFQSWTLVTAGGLTHAGLRLPKGGDNGEERYADSAGREFLLKSDQIELREPSDKSIMPDGLEKTLSIADLRDLVAFLSDADYPIEW